MKSSEPISNNVNLNDTMLQIIQTLENLKIKRDKINQDIEEGYQLREKIQQQLNLYGEQLQKVTDVEINKELEKDLDLYLPNYKRTKKEEKKKKKDNKAKRAKKKAAKKKRQEEAKKKREAEGK